MRFILHRGLSYMGFDLHGVCLTWGFVLHGVSHFHYFFITTRSVQKSKIWVGDTRC